MRRREETRRGQSWHWMKRKGRDTRAGGADSSRFTGRFAELCERKGTSSPGAGERPWRAGGETPSDTFTPGHSRPAGAAGPPPEAKIGLLLQKPGAGDATPCPSCPAWGRPQAVPRRHLPGGPASPPPFRSRDGGTPAAALRARLLFSLVIGGIASSAKFVCPSLVPPGPQCVRPYSEQGRC